MYLHWQEICLFVGEASDRAIIRDYQARDRGDAMVWCTAATFPTSFGGSVRQPTRIDSALNGIFLLVAVDQACERTHGGALVMSRQVTKFRHHDQNTRPLPTFVS